MVRIDLIDTARNLTYERKMPAPRAYTQSAPVKLTPARCLKALAGFAAFSAISLGLAAERVVNGQELLIAAILGYTGFSNLVRVIAIWQIYGRVSRGDTIYIHAPKRPPASPAVCYSVAAAVTLLALFVTVVIAGLLLTDGINILIRVAACFLGLTLWSAVIQSWKRALRS